MARPKKTGLDYFPFDVDFFSDKKIKRLRASYGNDGVAVYLYLLCEIYRSGYYVEYDDDLIVDIADELNITTNAITQILNYLFSRSLLRTIESKLAVPVKVITAESVQRRYQAAKKGARRDVDVAAEFWVLKKEETESFIKVHSENDFYGINDNKSCKNDDKSGIYCTKESKVKESKVKERKEEDTAPPSHTRSDYDALVSDYGKDKVEEYIRKVTDWYAQKNKSVSDLYGTVRKWLEQDGVKKSDFDADKYSFVINNF
jgi:hypothetical protein